MMSLLTSQEGVQLDQQLQVDVVRLWSLSVTGSSVLLSEVISTHFVMFFEAITSKTNKLRGEGLKELKNNFSTVLCAWEAVLRAVTSRWCMDVRALDLNHVRNTWG